MGGPFAHPKRYKRTYRRLMMRMIAYALLSYGFVTVYGALYGPEPVLLHRLGITAAVLCLLLAGIALVGWLIVTVSTLNFRRKLGESFF